MSSRSPSEPGRVAVLGLGTMGHAMATNACQAGLPTTVWDRAPDRGKDLAGLGAQVAATAPDAVAAAEVVVTMVPDLDAVLSVAVEQGALDAMANEAIWAQMSTIGLGIDRVVDVVTDRRPDVTVLDAPVSGSKGPAQAGALTIFASGPEQAMPRITPFFDAIGKRTVRVGPVGAGSRVKLVNNTLLAFGAEGLAESVALARRLGLPDAVLVDALDGSPIMSSWAQAKLQRIVDGDFSAEFALRLALKDVGLALEAGDPAVFRVLDRLADQWQQAVAHGLGDEDVVAVVQALEDVSHAAGSSA